MRSKSILLVSQYDTETSNAGGTMSSQVGTPSMKTAKKMRYTMQYGMFSMSSGTFNEFLSNRKWTVISEFSMTAILSECHSCQTLHMSPMSPVVMMTMTTTSNLRSFTSLRFLNHLRGGWFGIVAWRELLTLGADRWTR